MRKYLHLLFLLIISLTGIHSFSQFLPKPIKNNIKRCYTVEVMEDYRKSHSNAETDRQFENWLEQKIKNRQQAALRPAVDYTIPVIFHIIHNGELVGTSPNLDAAIINQQLLQLNKDFANASNSTYGTSSATGIQFVLAQKDPSNTVLAEPGIERINRNTKGWTDYTTGWLPSYLDGTVKPASIWNANNYLNIWVVPYIYSGTQELLGYSTFPASSTLPGLNNNENGNTAGVAIETGIVGSAFAPGNCDSDYGMGKTLAHECGHFFGLRHIWGDSNCGTDYCDDTPIHAEANYGVPAHPKSNSCGTADEMFENFMDYSSDIVLNTFTANQVERMQTVMLNSPRRLSLTTSNVGAVPVTGSNKISFINCTGNLLVNESGINDTYPRYKDVSLTLTVEDKATGSATVNVSASGSAINGSQYQLLTPTLNFAAGDNFKPIRVRVFDNSMVDGDRTIVLNYTISGTGVTAGNNAQSLTISLYDDDNMRVGENTINLLDEHFEAPVGARGLPAGWGLLSTNGYVNSFVGSTNGNAGGTGLCAHITNNTTTKANSYTKGVAGATVLVTPIIDVSSVKKLGNLSFKYTTSGLVDNNNGDDASLVYTTSTAPTGPFYYYGNIQGLTGYGPYSNNLTPVSNTPVIPAPGFFVSRKINIGFYWATGTLTTGTDPGFNLDDLVLSATPYPVETNVSNSYTFDIAPGISINNLKSTADKAMVSIINPSQSIAGVKARIIEAGTGNVIINTDNGVFLRTQKVFQISPSISNSTATYQGTLYFTAAELATWGADRLNLKILKVKDGVPLNSILNGSNAELITPTVLEDVNAGYISYTGNFTGFSQFMLVSPLTSLPVSFISFQAIARQKDIELVWSTAQEINNRGFAIERSMDGNNFKEIGWVDGNGTTSQKSTYTFTDNYVQANINYYYRIRQVDLDNRQAYSAIRNARLAAGQSISIMLSPNPAKDYANLFIKGTTNNATIELINASGQKLLQRNNVNAFNGSYKLPLNGLSKGVYNIRIYLPEGTFIKKIIIQ